MSFRFYPGLAASAVALAVLAGNVNAADVQPTSDCYLAGDVRVGVMNDWQGFSGSDDDNSVSGNADWFTPFGEGRGLVSCGGFNFQSDFAYYSHQGDDIEDGKDTISLDSPAGHFGGALFWRDQNVGLLGLSASWIHQDVFFKDSEYARIGGVGEFFLNEQMTIGASAHYFTDLNSKDINHDGFELAANLKYYATPDLSLKLEGALMLGELGDDDDSVDFDGFSVGLEGEYLAWDQGLSLFAGTRYAERTLSEGDTDLTFDDFQVYAGIKFAFGGNTESLMARDRSGPIDNTSIFHEKLPNATSSFFANLAGEEEPDDIEEVEN
jgi:hypothetical protein